MPEDNKQWFSQEGEEEATQHSDLNWRQGRPRPATPALAQSANRAVAARFEGPADLFQLGNIVPGMFMPVLAKHTKHLSLVDILSVGVDRMQRNFEPMRKQVEAWKGTRLQDEAAKLVIYRAFIEGKLDAPKHLARRVHDQYFNPKVEEFVPRTVWSLSNAFTSAFKDLDPIPQFKTTAKLASFLEPATTSSRVLGSNLVPITPEYDTKSSGNKYAEPRKSNEMVFCLSLFVSHGIDPASSVVTALNEMETQALASGSRKGVGICQSYARKLQRSSCTRPVRTDSLAASRISST